MLSPGLSRITLSPLVLGCFHRPLTFKFAAIGLLALLIFQVGSRRQILESQQCGWQSGEVQCDCHGEQPLVPVQRPPSMVVGGFWVVVAEPFLTVFAP